MPENWISSPERFEEEEEDQQKQQKLKGWKYELGRTLGEGNFGKVKYATHLESGRAFAVKILDKQRIIALKIDGQVSADYRSGAIVICCLVFIFSAKICCDCLNRVLM